MGLIPPGIPQGGQEAPSPPSSLQQGLGGQGEGLGPSAPRPNGLQNGFLGQRPGRSLEGSRAPPHQPDYFLGKLPDPGRWPTWRGLTHRPSAAVHTFCFGPCCDVASLTLGTASG